MNFFYADIMCQYNGNKYAGKYLIGFESLEGFPGVLRQMQNLELFYSILLLSTL